MRTLATVVLATLLSGCAQDKTAEKKPAPPPARVKPPGLYKVKFTPTKGDFTIEVHRAGALHGADHFFDLLQSRFYDGVRFHRVVRGFVSQFGISSNPPMQQIWGSGGIPDDPVKQKNKRGTMSYAKLGSNSRTTQVFINLAGNAILDTTGFAPSGKVIEGMDVVDKLYFAYGEIAPRGGGPDAAQIQLLRNTRKTELPSAAAIGVFPASLGARTAPFALLRNTRKTELPSAAATRVFPASLGARTAPFALLRNTRKTELPSVAATRVFLASLGARTAPFVLLGNAYLDRAYPRLDSILRDGVLA